MVSHARNHYEQEPWSLARCRYNSRASARWRGRQLWSSPVGKGQVYLLCKLILRWKYMNTPDLPKSCKQPSLWQVPLILLLIIIPLLIFSEKPFAIEHILLAIVCVFISLRMLTAYRFDADGVTIYFFGCIPQLVDWEDVTRIEYCEAGSNDMQYLVVELFGIPQIKDCFSIKTVSHYLFRHPIRARRVFLPSKKKRALFFSTIAQYHTIGGMIDLPKGEIFDPHKHCKSRKKV